MPKTVPMPNASARPATACRAKSAGLRDRDGGNDAWADIIERQERKPQRAYIDKALAGTQD